MRVADDATLNKRDILNINYSNKYIKIKYLLYTLKSIIEFYFI